MWYAGAGLLLSSLCWVAAEARRAVAAIPTLAEARLALAAAGEGQQRARSQRRRCIGFRAALRRADGLLAAGVAITWYVV